MAQLPLDLGFRPALGFDDFLVAPSNAAAVAWLDRWPDWPAPALVLHGDAGSGKTHLAHVWQGKARAVFIDPTALSVARVPALLGGAQAAIVDGADRANVEALLHLYNLAAERGGHLLVVAREPPARWCIDLADLRSRLLAAPAAALAAPDDALLASVLVKQFNDRQLVVGEDVIAYLLAHMERSFAAARATVAALDRAALAAQRRVSLKLARAVIEAGREPDLLAPE
jgi:chromosomal replication initiation ATPase DnaA